MACPLFSPLKNRRGMALLIALTVISLIVVITLGFNKNMRQNLMIAGIQRNGVTLETIARSGVAVGMAVLQQDAQENQSDSLHDLWAKLADEDLSSLFVVGDLHISITDNGGKFQINSLVQTKNQQQPGTDLKKATAQEQASRDFLWRLLRNEPFQLEDGEARKIIDSLIDWIDGEDGDWEQEFGAESSYYLGLKEPYACKNGPIEFVEELLLVQGMTPELLFGSDQHSGLAPLLTTQGAGGLLNINTASPLLLRALDEDLTDEMVAEMVDFREDEKNKEELSSLQWPIHAAPSLLGTNGLKNVTVKSDSFTIAAQGQLGEQRKEVVATVSRNAETQKVLLLSWKIE